MYILLHTLATARCACARTRGGFYSSLPRGQCCCRPAGGQRVGTGGCAPARGLQGASEGPAARQRWLRIKISPCSLSQISVVSSDVECFCVFMVIFIMYSMCSIQILQFLLCSMTFFNYGFIGALLY